MNQDIEEFVSNNKRERKYSDISDTQDQHYNTCQLLNPQHSVFNRKLNRKQKKIQQKQEKFNYWLQHKQKNKPQNQQNLESDQESKNIEQKQQNDQQQKEKEKLALKKQIQKEKQQSNKQQIIHEKTKLEKLQEEIKEDDQIIKYYEKLLGKDKKQSSKRLQREIKRDGLEDLFNLLDTVDKNMKTKDISKYVPFKETEDDIDIEDDDEQTEEEEEDEIEEEEYIESDEDQENQQEDEEDYQDEDSQEINDEEERSELQRLKEEQEQIKAKRSKQIDKIKSKVDKTNIKSILVNKNQKSQIEDKQIKNLDTGSSQNLNDNGVEDNKQIQKNKQKEEANLKITEKHQEKEQKNFTESQSEIEQKNNIRKIFTRSFNRVSEGNLDIIFSDIVNCFAQNPKFIVSPIFTEVFIKFTITPLKVQQHQISVNVSVLTAIHDLFDNQVFSIIIKVLMEQYIILFIQGKQDQNKKINLESLNKEESEFETELLLHQQKNNLIQVLNHLYIYDSLSIDFVKEFISEILTQDLNSEQNLDLLSQMIKILGQKIRKDSPAILKNIIDQIKQKLEVYQNQSKKVQFILLLLNDIKLNKNISSNPLERMQFLIQWLKKNRELNKVSKKIFILGFYQTLKCDKTVPKWWMPLENNNIPQGDNDEEGQNDFFKQMGLQDNRLNELLQLAQQYKMHTEIRKQVFVIVMSSEDYIDCSQKLLKLRLNKAQQKEIPIVLIECCLNEQQYNPYYFFVCKKFSDLNKKAKYFLTISIYDKFKIIDTYNLRKLANLSKFIASLVIEDTFGLQIIKNFDFELPSEHAMLFIKMFLDNYLKKVKPDILNSQLEKLKQNQENIIFIDQLRNFLKLQYRQHVEDEIIVEKIIFIYKKLKI